MNDGLVKRLVVICEHNFGTPKGTGPYFWQNVVQRILEEVMISTNAHGEVLVTHLALIARRAAHEYISTTAHKYKDIYKQNEAAELVSIRAVLSALAMMPVELPTADEIALVWLDGGKLGVLNLLRARLAPLLAARAATTADQPAVSIDDFAEALDLASTALPYDKRRRYNFDERFGRLSVGLSQNSSCCVLVRL